VRLNTRTGIGDTSIPLGHFTVAASTRVLLDGTSLPRMAPTLADSQNAYLHHTNTPPRKYHSMKFIFAFHKSEESDNTSNSSSCYEHFAGLQHKVPRRRTSLRTSGTGSTVGITSGMRCYCNRVSMRLVVSFMLDCLEYKSGSDR
jgi:hypothetical protein